MAYNEDSRVKIPALLHLTRLGYNYLLLKNAVWNENTNIFTDVLANQQTNKLIPKGAICVTCIASPG